MQVVFKCRCFLEVVGPAILPNASGRIEKVHYTENSYELKSQSSGVKNCWQTQYNRCGGGNYPQGAAKGCGHAGAKSMIEADRQIVQHASAGNDNDEQAGQKKFKAHRVYPVGVWTSGDIKWSEIKIINALLQMELGLAKAVSVEVKSCRNLAVLGSSNRSYQWLVYHTPACKRLNSVGSIFCFP